MTYVEKNNYCYIAILVTTSMSANDKYWIELFVLDCNNWNRLTM